MPVLLPTTPCPRCGVAMNAVALESFDGKPLKVDHCRACRLVWFDAMESVRLEALGWVRLLRDMQRDLEAPLGHTPDTTPDERTSCPVCRSPLRGAHNLTRFGRFVTGACPNGHGDLQSDVGVLAQRGMVRPLGAAERRALIAERHAIHCLNCGASAQPGDDVCSWCRPALVVLALPRLAHSLLPRPLAEQASPTGIGTVVEWSCRGCGMTIDVGRHTHCTHCGHMVVALDMPDLGPLLDAAEQRLHAHTQARAGVADAWRRSRAQVARGDADQAGRLASRLRALVESRWMLGGWLPLWAALGVALLVAALG
jgi:hypothetical protein